MEGHCAVEFVVLEGWMAQEGVGEAAEVGVAIRRFRM